MHSTRLNNNYDVIGLKNELKKKNEIFSGVQTYQLAIETIPSLE